MTPPAMVEVGLVVTAHALAAWVATYLVHSTLVFAGAWGLTGVRALAPSDEVRVWRFAIVAPLGTAAVQTFITAGWSPLAVEMADAAPAALADWRMGAMLLAPAALVPLALLAIWRLGRLRLLRAMGSRTTAPEIFQREATELASAAGGRQPRVTVSTTAAVPAAVGTDEICVPIALFGTLSREERRALLAHELGHLTKQDPVWLAILGCLSQVIVFQPLNRFAIRRLRGACERAADDFAVRLTGEPAALARALTSIAAVVLILSGGAAAAGSPIVERVRRILDDASARRQPSGGRVRLAWVSAAIMVLLFLTPGATSTVEQVSHRLPWLTPSREEPNARMLEVRRAQRQWRETVRRAFR